MVNWRSQHFINEGRQQGIAEPLLRNATLIARRIQAVNADLPPLFTLRHLSHEVGVPYLALRSIVSRKFTCEPYRVFSLRKKNVGHGSRRFRVICVPDPALLKTQRWIHSRILKFGRCHEASGAYSKGSGIYDVASTHCNARWLVKLDVTNFFDAILEPKVYQVFARLGYQPLMAFELARLCTRLRHDGNPKRKSKTGYRKIWTYGSSVVGHLPQGAPTSPLLANLVAYDLDSELFALAENANVRYTRYADDIVFSSSEKAFTRSDAEGLIRGAYACLERHGLWANRAKTHVVSPAARKIVLGLLVDGPVPKLQREFKDKLRMHIHYLHHPQIGPVEHARRRGFDNVLGLQRHLLGLAAFAMGIEPAWGRQQMDEIKRANWPIGIPPFK
ncbi:reverse transcriptase family protein [Paraburkholderia phytofirmans]|uniref:reverse transcriptase family protein n=1 Tax=Paraburkholderia phytofirmans TaxID=261302 RepID=UPI0007B60CE2|nr:reverse transcriptase family protein [Paraburkholderia phytofirmans]